MGHFAQYDSLDAYTAAKPNLPKYHAALVTVNGKDTIVYSEGNAQSIEDAIDSITYGTIEIDNWE